MPLYVLAVSGGTLVQSTLAPALPVAGVVPDVPLIVVVLLALRRGVEAGCLSGFALGIAQDVLAGGPLGLHAVSKAVLGFAVGDLPRLFLVGRPAVTVAVVAIATIVDGASRFVLLQLFQYPAPFAELLHGVILPQAAYNGALAALLLAVPAVRVRA
jgi:rod shape-determining protein MreD